MELGTNEHRVQIPPTALIIQINVYIYIYIEDMEPWAARGPEGGHTRGSQGPICKKRKTYIYIYMKRDIMQKVSMCENICICNPLGPWDPWVPWDPLVLAL